MNDVVIKHKLVLSHGKFCSDGTSDREWRSGAGRMNHNSMEQLRIHSIRLDITSTHQKCIRYYNHRTALTKQIGGNVSKLVCQRHKMKHHND